VPEYDVLGYIRERAGNALPGIVPSNTYPTRDGKYVIIGANNDAIFKRMMNTIGRAELGSDPQLATNAGRAARMVELDDAISDWTRKHDLDDVLAALEKAEVPASKIYDVADIVRDAHYLARGMLERHKLPDGKEFRLPGIVPKLSAAPGATKWIGPALGAHTAEVLAALGYDDAKQQELKKRGVI
jgi:formyl-CoA transferase